MRCAPDLLITAPHLALDQGAMAGSKPGAFFGEPDGQYMQTLRAAALAAGVAISGPYRDLSPQAKKLALFGAGTEVFEVVWNYRRGKRSGSHEFTGPWIGLCALVEHEARVRAKRKNASQWSVPLAPVPCDECGGERLHKHARQVSVAGLRLPIVSALELTGLVDALRTLALPPADAPVLDAIRPGLLARLDTLMQLGLGHLSLSRTTASLSTGELQRLRLAGVLDSELSQITLVLDEPGTGLDDERLDQLLRRLRAFCEQGNTVVMVCHRQVLIHGADSVLTLGPGAGIHGGRLVPEMPAVVMPSRPPLNTAGRMRIKGARAHTLQSIDLELPDQGLVAISGPSGSGKSSLLFDVIAASATAGRAVECEHITGLERFDKVLTSRLTERRPPLTTLGLLKPVQALFHGVGSALPKSAFSFHSAAGRCPTCKGAGVVKVAMDFMADLALECATCGGQRYKPEVLDVRWQGMNAAEFLAAPVQSLAPLVPTGALADAVSALCQIGLGHISLGRPGHVLSGGEHQRIMLAGALAAAKGPTLLALDEPGSGLQAHDLARLLDVLHSLAERGSLVLFTTHRSSLLRGAHWHIKLGPEGGSRGGRLVSSTASTDQRS